MRTAAAVTLRRSVSRWPAFFLTAGFLFLWGIMANGCSPDKDANPAGAASYGDFGGLFKPVDGEPSAAPAAKQPLAAADEKEKFHVYLAFGQSNMEGQNWSGSSITYGDVIPMTYKENVDPRFRVMAAVGGSYKISNSQSEQRVKGQWYRAVPPLVRNNTGLCPADYFGRVLVAGIADADIKVGVIAVAVAGAAIEGFEKGNGANTYFSSEQSWMQNTAALYGNNPYDHLVTLAKEAQSVGVIKGIIMHQGESGAKSGNWAQKVKGIYDNLLIDLGLPANSIPFIAGEPYGAASGQNNAAAIRGLTNTMTAKLPSGENVAHVVSSAGCASGGDNLHFSYEGYRKLGEEYGKKMLELNYKDQPPGATSVKNVTSRPN
ncbi:MAG: sialate O-acetylesterase [Chitinispirillales bacterium]|jgi:peptidyl-tRNA hydrolase|nr:sialate O-acetylesterase [Chitinispirillales bacterium]